MSREMTAFIGILAYLILAPLLGGLLAGIDRKITAKMQGRKGPSVFQAFYDVHKLLEKETIIANKMQYIYVWCFLMFIVFTGALFFGGFDILLVFLSLTTAAMFLVFASASANSPFSMMGSQRELAQMLSYEPMVLLTAVGFYMATDTFVVNEIASTDYPAIITLPGVFIGFVFILSIKLRKSPFDLSTSHHAHQEMVMGITTDISGRMLAIIEISHWYENIFLLGVVGLFFVCNCWWSILLAIAGIAISYFFEILLDNVCARVKWDVMIEASWAVTLIAGGLNLMILEYFL